MIVKSTYKIFIRYNEIINLTILLLTELGLGERIIKQLRGEKKVVVDLKAEMKKLIFNPPSGEPLIVSEDSGLFQIVMSSFQWYEKQVGTCTVVFPLH